MQQTQKHLFPSVLKQRLAQASQMSRIVTKMCADDTGHTPQEKEEVDHISFSRVRLLTSFTSVEHVSMVLFIDYGDQLNGDVLRND